MDYKLLSLIIMIFSLVIIFISYERKQICVKQIALVASLSALAGISRVPFTALPNVQPMTFLVIISGYVFGSEFGFLVGAVATIVSNAFIGHGPWTPWQMFAWGLAGFSGGLIGKFKSNPSRIFLSMFCFMWGFLFDYIMNIWHYLFFIQVHTLQTFIATYSLSFYFDLMHSIGNFLFAYILGKDFINILSRFKDRISYMKV